MSPWTVTNQGGGPEDDPTTMYVDDTSSVVTSPQLHTLAQAAQVLVNKQVQWLEDNGMVVSPAKSKLLISANKDLRRARVQGQHQGVTVQGRAVMPTQSERILGLYIDQDLTWKSYLWGEKWRQEDNFPGLIPQLMGRAALLHKLAELLPRSTMPSLVSGLFMSKLMYAMQVFCHTWGLPTYRDLTYKAATISKDDVTILQILQNKALRCITGGRIRDCTTRELLEATGYLSVHQLVALLTLTSFHNARMSGRPRWVLSQITPLVDTRTRRSQIMEISARLNSREESYLPRAIKLYNLLPVEVKSLTKPRFREAVRTWVWDNISIKP